MLATQLSMDAALERDESWSERASAYIVKLSPGERLTSDVLRTMVGDPAGSGCSLGALFRRMEKRGLLAYTNRDVLSQRPAARGRYLRVWERTAR